jgi:hypothetical protein
LGSLESESGGFVLPTPKDIGGGRFIRQKEQLHPILLKIFAFRGGCPPV